MATTTTGINEACWVILGDWERKLWHGVLRKYTSGQPASVEFDHNWVWKREESKRDILGFAHTHPGFLATPSARDHLTMRAWVNALDKSLLCVIKGVDGLRGWWYDDDENDPIECQVMQFGRLLVGTTEEEG